MRRRAFIAGLVSATAWPLVGHVQADEVVVTDIDLIFQTIKGQSAVCGFEYRVAFRDRANMQDGLTGAYGSMEWRRVNGELSMKAKIGALAFSSITQDAIARAPALNGFLSVGGKPIHPVQTDHCGNPGAFCAVYSPEVAMLVYASLLPPGMRPAGDLAIGVQRRAGKVETILPLELSLETFASEKFKSFIDCMKEILDRGWN
jgi:hypothetical protein